MGAQVSDVAYGPFVLDKFKVVKCPSFLMYILYNLRNCVYFLTPRKTEIGISIKQVDTTGLGKKSIDL